MYAIYIVVFTRIRENNIMNAIILGWFGEKNIGDDLILRASLNILQKNKNI